MGVTKKVEKKAEGAKNPIAVLVRRAGAIIGSEAWFFNIDILEVLAVWEGVQFTLDADA